MARSSVRDTLTTVRPLGWSLVVSHRQKVPLELPGGQLLKWGGMLCCGYQRDCGYPIWEPRSRGCDRSANPRLTWPWPSLEASLQLADSWRACPETQEGLSD
eukprot:jgi/Botrbrau1/7531/Bobra.0019s0019.1